MWPYTERETDFLGPPRPRGELAARTLAMPADTNPSGDIFGGWLRRSSMTLCVEVWVLRQGRGRRVKVTAAEFTFVALDGAGAPRPVTRAGSPAGTPRRAP